MKFRFKNLGPIKNADLELGDLTIIAGHNNTGKTRVAYALYGFLRTIDNQLKRKWALDFAQNHFLRFVQRPLIDITQELLIEGQFEWSLNRDSLRDERNSLITEMTREYSKNQLFRVFNSSPSQFQNASFQVDSSQPLIKIYSTYGPFGQDGLSIEIKTDEKRTTVKLSGLSAEERNALSPASYMTTLTHSCLRFLLGGTFFSIEHVSVFPSIRNALSLFLHDLDFIKSQVAYSLQFRSDQSPEERAFNLLPVEKLMRYPLPVQDSIDFHRRILYLENLFDKKPDHANSTLIEEMLNGKYRVVNRSLRFGSLSDNIEPYEIPLHNASSSVQELVGLNFLLKELIPDTTSLIIIDEPESHLDTRNQILFARILANLVNFGQSVLITTHSDYIIREINNLIMLSSRLEDEKYVRNRFKYHPNDKLCLEQVKAYVAENGGLTPCRMDKFGVEITSLDEVIDDLNEASEELASQIMMKEEE